MNAKRLGLQVVGAGILLEVVGVVVDAFGDDGKASSRVFTADSLGRALFFAGLALAVAGLFVALAGPRVYGVDHRGVPRATRLMQLGTPAALIAVVAAGALITGGVSIATRDRSSTVLPIAAGAGAHVHGSGLAGGIETGAGTSPCEQSGPPASKGQVHGHRGPSPQQPITDPATRALLGRQLETAREAAFRFPTAADAQAAGYIRVTPYIPCIGAHWINPSLMDRTFDPAAPEMLLYDSSGIDGRIVGLSYWVRTGKGNGPPDGFAGPNDIWHQHLGLCVGLTGVIGAEDTTARECAARGGIKTDGRDSWMLHAWVVPGWESAWGVFSGEHPELGVSVPR